MGILESCQASNGKSKGKFFKEPVWKLKENRQAKLKTFINGFGDAQQDRVRYSPRKGEEE